MRDLRAGWLPVRQSDMAVCGSVRSCRVRRWTDAGFGSRLPAHARRRPGVRRGAPRACVSRKRARRCAKGAQRRVGASRGGGTGSDIGNHRGGRRDLPQPADYLDAVGWNEADGCHLRMFHCRQLRSRTPGSGNAPGYRSRFASAPGCGCCDRGIGRLPPGGQALIRF